LRDFAHESLPGGIRPSDDAAGDTGAGVADRQSSVVELCIDDDATPQDGIFRAVDSDIVHRDFESSDSLDTGLQISQVAGVTLRRGEQAVLVTLGVVMPAGAGGVRSGSIAEFVDVDGLFGVGTAFE